MHRDHLGCSESASPELRKATVASGIPCSLDPSDYPTEMVPPWTGTVQPELGNIIQQSFWK